MKLNANEVDALRLWTRYLSLDPVSRPTLVIETDFTGALIVTATTPEWTAVIEHKTCA